MKAAAGRRRVVVVGGGITGLAAAWYLLRAAAARPGFEVVALEADRRAGGKLRTERRDGFLIEAGPDSFLTGKPAAVDLCRELGLTGALIPQRQPRSASVLRRGRLVPIPPGLRLVHPTRPWALLRSPLLSPAGRLRALAHPLVPRRADAGDESVGAYVRRRYGREMLRVLGEPLLAGIHLADPWQLSLTATFPGLRTPHRRGGNGGTAAGARGPADVPHLRGSPFASLSGGMEQLVDALGARLGRALRTGAAVTAIAPAPAGYRVRLDGPAGGAELDAAAVVVTTPAAVAARLAARLNPPLAQRLAAAEATTSAVVTLGYAGIGGGFPASGSGFPAAGSGFLVPRGEGCRLLACTWSSAKWPGRAPAGGLLLRAFIGGWRHPHLPDRTDDELLALVQDELAHIPGFAFIRAGAPAVRRVQRWPDGTPLYRVGHREWLAGVRSACSATPGVWLAGAPYDGVGIPDCIRSARAAADAATAYLRR